MVRNNPTLAHPYLVYSKKGTGNREQKIKILFMNKQELIKGRLLVTQLIHAAKQHYQLLTLRTDTLAAAEFYQKLGFKTHPSWEHTTHHLQLNQEEDYPLSLY